MVNGPLAVPCFGSCASSGRACRLWAEPLAAQPPPRLLEQAASKAADFTAFDHSGVAGSDDTRGALHVGCDPDPEVRDLPLAQLRAQTRNLELRGHRGRKRTYIEP